MFNPNPASSYVDVTPSDATEFDPPLKAVWVGGAGDVTLKSPNGDTATFTVDNVPAIIPAVASYVMATGTDATAIVGLID